MTPLALTLAAVLALGSPVFAQQAQPSPSQSLQPSLNLQPPQLRDLHKGFAEPIPAWDIHGHAEEIPTLRLHSTIETKASSISRRSCLIVSQRGSRYTVVESFLPAGVHIKKSVRERDLKQFTANGGLVETLPSPYTKDDLESARAACSE
jgi:hypothetical protein